MPKPLSMPRRRRLGGAIVNGTIAGSIVLAGVGLTAGPAAAVDNGCALTGATNGAIGVGQSLSLTNCSTLNGTVVVTVNYPALGVVQSVPVTVTSLLGGPGGFGTTVWNPNTVGVANLSTGTPILASLSIVPVSTTTTISAPNTAQLGVSTNLTAVVQSVSPSITQPLGSVIFRDGNGNPLATIALQRGASTSQAIAVWSWVPPSLGNFIFNASYVPSNIQGQPATTGASSTTAADTVLVTPSGSNIALTMPPAVFLGTPTTIAATVFPTNTQGSVGFTVNGKPISASVPIVNGSALFVWTPTILGQQVVGANFTGNGGQSGATQNVVTVQQSTQADVITLTQPGFGIWAPNGTFPLGNGTSFTFTATTLSGASVALRDTGACNTSGLALTIDTGTGQCNIIAVSAGGNGYQPVSQGYLVNMVPGMQTATLAAPNSGRVNVGNTIRLATARQGQTNARQTITWSITQGRNTVCRLAFPNSGVVNLRINKRGQCTFRARAAGVPNSWAPFQLQRTYTAR